VISNYLSNQAVFCNGFSDYFINPYAEGVNNLRCAVSWESLGFVRRVTHLVAGIGLVLPVVNTIVMLAIRAFILYSFSTSEAKSLDREKQAFTEKFLDEIFTDYTTWGNKGGEFTVIKEGEQLFVSGDKRKILLSDLLSAISWSSLPEKWQGLTDSDLKAYKIKTMVRSKKELLDEFSKEMAQKFPELKSKNHPFLKMYTQDFYSILNSLLRDGELAIERFSAHGNGTPDSYKSLIHYNYPEILEKLLGISTLEHGEELQFSDEKMFSRFVKEILFIALMTTGTLQAIPPFPSRKLSRIITLSQKSIDVWRLAALTHTPIVDRGFCSTSHGGTFSGAPSGGGQFVRSTVQGKRGRDLSMIGLGGEKEVLFQPFTQFKVIKIDKKGTRTEIALEEI